MTDGFGSITWWGFSPALDLLEPDLNEAFSKLCNENKVPEKDDINILLMGAGDCRHILKTIAQAHRHSQKNLNFYVLENSLELYARDMLLLSIVLEAPHRMGLQEKTEMFLELYGNSLVREQAMDYVQKMSTAFIKMVTDFDYLEKILPIFNLSLLKFKERDFLEAIFKFWRSTSKKDYFDILLCWDLRLRKYLGTRYDAIPNVFDWDYSMKLCEKDAEIIHSVKYRKWREKGVAFEIREGAYDCPNRTLASGLVFNVEGERLGRRGYWGDIIVSPFIPFGIECEEKKFFKKSNNALTSTSEIVSEYNILSLLHELTNKTKYVAPEPVKQDEKSGPTLTEITEEEEDEENETTENLESQNSNGTLASEYECMNISNVKINFLPIASAQELHKKSKYQGLFDLIYISNSLVHNLNSDLASTFANYASLILETSKYMLELKKENHQTFNQKITDMAESIPGCKASFPVSLKDNFAKFVYKRSS